MAYPTAEFPQSSSFAWFQSLQLGAFQNVNSLKPFNIRKLEPLASTYTEQSNQVNWQIFMTDQLITFHTLGPMLSIPFYSP